MVAPLLFLDSTPVVQPVGVPPEFVSGFGTVMGEERELLIQIRGIIARIQGQHSPDLIQLLRQHDRQIGAVIGLIARRQGELPEQVRFHILRPPSYLMVYPRRPPIASPPGVLPELIAFHVRLASAFEALIKVGSRRPGLEPLLEQAILHHECMAEALHGLREANTEELCIMEPAVGKMTTAKSILAAYYSSIEKIMSRAMLLAFSGGLIALVWNLITRGRWPGASVIIFFGLTMILMLLKIMNGRGEGASRRALRAVKKKKNLVLL